MHGNIQRESTSFRSSRSSCSRHMRSVPPLVTKNNTLVIKGDHDSSFISDATTSTGDSFLKDGRKICVGDCALFKPTQDSPPYIGLIRRLKFGEDIHLQLGVNWLYRPAEIKLGKGIVVEGTPNEIFYSFHEDEIPAESLLHPCKVAFLPKGVELPARTSSFVCRRVYDITNKSLWWLTDEDYINDRQEEVDQLLQRTRVEMQAPLHSGPRSPKQANGPTSNSQVKAASDSVNNTGIIPARSQVKGKKRERGDQGGEQVRRERCSRSDDSDSTQCKTEGNLKSEIARITQAGGLVDFEGVERLVQLMQHGKKERKTNLVYRSILASVMASTDKAECLDRFVQLRGLPIFDEWLQDVHKGKIGDSNSLKDSDVSVDEFLLVLLRALDKLPVDLQALQMCNIGRSVNHLRTHKNSKIQRKARSLVDSWKKRVEAEMITNEAKSVSTQSVSVWPSKSRLTEPSPGSVRTATCSDAAIKSSMTQCTVSKTTSARPSHVDCDDKSTTSFPGHAKPASSPPSVEENLVRVSVVGFSDAPIVREDRSSSSNQSHSQSQSSSGKEEEKSGSVLMTVNKMPIIGTRNRKGGFSGIAGTGIQKEIHSDRSSSMIMNAPLEKLNQSASSVDKVLDAATSEASSHKMIVKIPNMVHSPAQGVANASQEDLTSTCSRVSSPVLFDRSEYFDHALVEKTDTHSSNVVSEAHVASWRNHDAENAQNMPDETSVSPLTLLDEGKCMKADSKKKNQVHLKARKLHASSFSPMNALMNCVKYSEANSSMSLDDDVGMNLLATVAADEISRSELLSPTESTEGSVPTSKDICPDDEVKPKSVPGSALESQILDDSGCDVGKPAVLDGTPCSQEGWSLDKHEVLDSKPDSSQVLEDLRIHIISADRSRNGEITADSLKGKCSPSDSGTNGIIDFKLNGAEGIVSAETTNFNGIKARDCKTIILGAAYNQFSEVCRKEDAIEDGRQTAHEKPALSADNGYSVVQSADKGADVCTSIPVGLNFDNKAGWISTSGQLNKEQNVGTTPTFAEASSSTRPFDGDAKVEFDLNEGFIAEEGKYGEPVNLVSSSSTSLCMMNSLSFSVNPLPSSHSTSITVAAAAKGPFVPPDDLLRIKGELGWRGSAATSAFRPAEPRKVLRAPLVSTSLSMADDSSSKTDRATFDIDLNVPDESALEEMAFQDAFVVKTGSAGDHCKFVNEPSISGSLRELGGLDLDLNRVDDACDTGNCSTSNHHKYQVSIHQQVKVGIPSQLSTANLRMNGPGQGSFSSWFSPGNSYSAIAIPSMFPDRGEHPFPVFSPNAAQRTFTPSGATSFTPAIYRGSVLSSSPAVPFPSSTFPLPPFPFGETYTLPSSTFSMGATSYLDPASGARLFGHPAVHSQFFGPVGSVVPQFQRSYMVALPENSTNGSLESNRRWGRQGFDLNAGPGAVESEVREEMFPILSGQNSLSSLQGLADEQAKMYSLSSGMVKGKEPEGGLDNESFRFKQSSWQ